MRNIGNRYFRCIYSYEFSDNCVYVGLTYNLTERQQNRDSHSGDSVTQHINKTQLTPIRKQLTNYIPVNEARKLEKYYLETYKLNGWNILNKKPTGGIGSNLLVWNHNKCIEVAKLCKTRTEFNKNYRGAYSAAVKNGWIDEIHKILVSNRGGKTKYTKQICLELALKCTTRKEFKEKYLKEFTAAYSNKWLNDICQHMMRMVKWTKENAYIMSLNCKNKTEFKIKYRGAYEASLKNNWLNDFFYNKNI